MCTISFYKEALNMTTHNLHPGLELTSPVCFSNGKPCYVYSDQQTDADNAMVAIFGIHLKQKDFKGALLYKLQRKYATRTDNQPNSSAAPVEGTATDVHLLVIWNAEYHNYGFYIYLIECADDFTWDEDKLWALHYQYNDQFRKDYNYEAVTWSIHDSAVIKMRSNTTYGSIYRLDIVISEGTEKYTTLQPIQIDPKRSVCYYRC
jgi:hypothetical protein